MFKLKKTGASDIDSQHSQLIDRMNQLYQAIKEPGAESLSLQYVLDDLNYYAVTHFSYEEEGMKLRGYPEYEDHQKQHEFFKMQMQEMQLKINAKDYFVATEVLLFLRKWLLSHISKADVEYVNFYSKPLKKTG